WCVKISLLGMRACVTTSTIKERQGARAARPEPRERYCYAPVHGKSCPSATLNRIAHDWRSLCSHKMRSLACALSDVRGEVSAHANTCLLSLFCSPFSLWVAFLVLATPYASPSLITPTTPASRSALRRACPRGGWSRTAQSNADIAARQCGFL